MNRSSLSAWERFWFQPGQPATLLTVRALVFSAMAVDIVGSWHRYSAIPKRAATIWEPISLLNLLSASAPSEAFGSAILRLTLVGCCLAIVPHPRLARIGGIVGGVGFGLLLLMFNSLGKIDHAHQPLVIAGLAMAMVNVPQVDAQPSWKWRWPVEMARVAFGIMFLAAAWSKLTIGGVEWVLSENLRNRLAAESLMFRDPPLSSVSLWIAAEPWRWKLAAFGALVGEGIAVGAVLTRKQPWQWLLAVIAQGTVAGITLLMGLLGFPLVVVGAILFDIEGATSAWKEHGKSKPALFVVVGVITLCVGPVLITMHLEQLLPLLLAAVTWLLSVNDDLRMRLVPAVLTKKSR